MKNKKTILLTGLAALIISLMSFGLGPGKSGSAGQNDRHISMPGKPDFAAIDANDDGKISKEEFLLFARSQWNKRDKNQDGRLDRDECIMFDTFNTDGDDYVSMDEFRAGQLKKFQKMDTNGDGFVSKAEFNQTMGGHNGSKCGSGKCGSGKTVKSKCGAGKCGSGN